MLLLEDQVKKRTILNWPGIPPRGIPSFSAKAEAYLKFTYMLYEHDSFSWR